MAFPGVCYLCGSAVFDTDSLFNLGDYAHQSCVDKLSEMYRERDRLIAAQKAQCFLEIDA